MGTLIFPYFRHNPNELVFGDRASPWYHGVEYIEARILNDLHFEDGFENINEALQEIKAIIFHWNVII